MSFNSFSYLLIFLPVVVGVSHVTRRLPWKRGAQAWIVLASLLFYAYSKPFNLVYLFISIFANWYWARWIGASLGNRRLRILQLSLLFNISYLSLFKYLNFFISSVPWLVAHGIHVPDFGFPLGISFFTVAQIMYLVDCYEELIPPSSLFDHVTFVTFFPYVISGPISRAKRILHQVPKLSDAAAPSADTVVRALSLLAIGLLKKVVFADAFSTVADFGWTHIPALSSAEALTSITSYAFQLYFDFSGYSDIAVASALLLDIQLPINFDAPLRSTSIIEFWKRWHITLSAFITTYLYTPILRSFQKATVHTAAIATITAMTIAGLWHGPNWTFVIFGAIHGIALAINQYWKKWKLPIIPNWSGWLLTLFVVDIGFVFFRSPDLQTSLLLLARLFNWSNFFGRSAFIEMDGLEWTNRLILIVPQAVGVFVALVGKSSDEFARDIQPTWKTCAFTTACLFLVLTYLNSSVSRPFVYFAF
jgi:D-alanyl-lipoteichoic acid acyltransferase DltB (MBOAT superfamily)